MNRALCVVLFVAEEFKDIYVKGDMTICLSSCVQIFWKFCTLFARFHTYCDRLTVYLGKLDYNLWLLDSAT